MKDDDDGAVLDRMYGALARGDLESALACLAPDAQVWHCFDGIVDGREKIDADLAQLISAFTERGNADIRREPIAGGFMQRHMFFGRPGGGKRVAWAVCLIVRVEDGLVTRIDEYIDRKGMFEVADGVPVTTPHHTR